MQFRSPKYEQASIDIPGETADLQKNFNGTVCSKKGDEYRIENNIIDFLGSESPELTLAQNPNHWKITAAIYEELWRKRSLSILTGQGFPIKKEKKLLSKWLQPRAGQTYLDVGCSTALYGREIKKCEPECGIVALDNSLQMLKEARLKGEAAQTSLFLLRADAQKMPFFGATFHGLMMGGTLNELTDPQKVLYECRRVLREGGTFFMMHLVKADAWYMRLMQNSTEFSGLQFWTIEASNQLFRQTGFEVSQQFSEGIVCFSKLLAV
jgi:ubiquinone/menaquinone biosynthesis C-methylase UbiE